jgi:hypothetical protein
MLATVAGWQKLMNTKKTAIRHLMSNCCLKGSIFNAQTSYAVFKVVSHVGLEPTTP